MSEEIIKPFRCPNGHTLGTVTRNGRGVRRLVLCDERISATITGNAVIRCQECGRERHWVPGAEATRELVISVRHHREVIERALVKLETVSTTTR